LYVVFRKNSLNDDDDDDDDYGDNNNGNENISATLQWSKSLDVLITRWHDSARVF